MALIGAVRSLGQIQRRKLSRLPLPRCWVPPSCSCCSSPACRIGRVRFCIEFTIDRAALSRSDPTSGERKPALVPSHSGWRQLYERGASEWLAENSRGVLLVGDRLTRDLPLAVTPPVLCTRRTGMVVATRVSRGRGVARVWGAASPENGIITPKLAPLIFSRAPKAGNALAGYESPESPRAVHRSERMILGDR